MILGCMFLAQAQEGLGDLKRYSTYAALSKWMYKSSDAVPEGYELLDKGDHWALLADKTSPGVCVVAHEGSSDVEDWINNLKSVSDKEAPLSGVQGNAGFWDAYVEFKQAQDASLLKYSSRCSTIDTTGHSLGGATSQLFAVDIANNSSFTIKVRDVVTFGSPNVWKGSCDNVFKSVSGSFVRFLRKSSSSKFPEEEYLDVVPALPPGWDACAASSYGALSINEEGGDPSVAKVEESVPTLGQGLGSLFLGGNPGAWHSSDVYLAILEAHASTL